MRVIHFTRFYKPLNTKKAMLFKKKKFEGVAIIPMFTTLCGKISASQTINCNNPLQAGSEDTLTLINWEDWLDASLTLNGTNTQIVENIVLASGITAFSMDGKNNSIAPKFELIKQPYAEVYNHELNYKVFGVNASAKEQLEKKAKGRFVAIVHNKFKGASGDSAFEIYGADAGLVVTQMIRDVNSSDTQGAFDIILKTSELSPEPHMPKTLFVTDYATTKAIVEGLL